MKIPLNEISTPGLLRLMRDVAAELEARHNAPAVQHVQATRPVETVRVPPEDDADFCLMIAARVKAGGYVKADERMRVAEIALKHASWVRRQGLPTEHNTGPWRKAGQLLSAKRSIER